MSAQCCTKHSKAPGLGYAAVHSVGSQGGKLGTKGTCSQGRPGRTALSTPRRLGRGRSRCVRHPFPPNLFPARRPGNGALDPPLYLARRSAAPPSPSRGPHRQRLAAAGSIAPQAGRSHAALSGSDALSGRSRAGRAALATRPPGLGAQGCSSLVWLLILRTRRCDAQAQSEPETVPDWRFLHQPRAAGLCLTRGKSRRPHIAHLRNLPRSPLNSDQWSKRLAPEEVQYSKPKRRARSTVLEVWNPCKWRAFHSGNSHLGFECILRHALSRKRKDKI